MKNVFKNVINISIYCPPLAIMNIKIGIDRQDVTVLISTLSVFVYILLLV